ncbi:MAG: hypothetical protein EWV92_15205 [Microcystis aeruginosa Ma_MB_S_20031200_S102]|uniref:Uncharacterized protein n=1 Tax=Microcystis aeruginosa Ma_MB_S_20031200_S102 TaxID=2486254 RepID=A0A552EJ89_MICAE|nr:MAG: hypothetical protein EWV92_15205 [Microcystis aeruginosa Ma_MB_S_20031200_S102]
MNYGSSVCLMQWTGVIRDGTLIYKGIWRFLSIAFDLKRTNQLNLNYELGRWGNRGGGRRGNWEK